MRYRMLGTLILGQNGMMPFAVACGVWLCDGGGPPSPLIDGSQMTVSDRTRRHSGSRWIIPISAGGPTSLAQQHRQCDSDRTVRCGAGWRLETPALWLDSGHAKAACCRETRESERRTGSAESAARSTMEPLNWMGKSDSVKFCLRRQELATLQKRLSAKGCQRAVRAVSGR